MVRVLLGLVLPTLLVPLALVPYLYPWPSSPQPSYPWCEFPSAVNFAATALVAALIGSAAAALVVIRPSRMEHLRSHLADGPRSSEAVGTVSSARDVTDGGRAREVGEGEVGEGGCCGGRRLAGSVRGLACFAAFLLAIGCAGLARACYAVCVASAHHCAPMLPLSALALIATPHLAPTLTSILALHPDPNPNPDPKPNPNPDPKPNPKPDPRTNPDPNPDTNTNRAVWSGTLLAALVGTLCAILSLHVAPPAGTDRKSIKLEVRVARALLGMSILTVLGGVACVITTGVPQSFRFHTPAVWLFSVLMVAYPWMGLRGGWMVLRQQHGKRSSSSEATEKTLVVLYTAVSVVSSIGLPLACPDNGLPAMAVYVVTSAFSAMGSMAGLALCVLLLPRYA